MLGVVGLDHHGAPTAVRERLAFLDEALLEALATLHRSDALAEAVILCTCNRTEIYAAGPAWAAVRAVVEEFLRAQYVAGASASQLPALEYGSLTGEDALNQYLYASEGLEAFMMRGYTTVLGGDRKDMEVLLARSRQEMKDRNMHSYILL